MSDAEATSIAPRRSRRDKRQVERFGSDNTKKRKRVEESDSDTPEPASDSDDQDAESEERDEQPRRARPKRKAISATKPKPKVVKSKPPPQKRPRIPKIAPAKVGPKATKRTRKPRGADTGEPFDAERLAKDTHISGDNPLFNAIVNSSANLQSTVEDFLESLSQSPEHALAELINCILRCCGCSDTVNSDQVTDYDGVGDVLEDVTEALKNDDSSVVYPVSSKFPIFKKFRKSLAEFFERLIFSSAESDQLYNTELMRCIQCWVTLMSVSHIRGFRHTSTIIALEIETALADVAASVEKEAEVIARQRKGERKRKGGAGGGSKELDAKANAVREKRTKVAEYLKDFVDGVFMLRYRDTDWAIRMECVHALGNWFQKHPSHFLDSTYLRYIGWVFSDENMHVRLEAVRALEDAYEQEDHISSLQSFTSRFKTRIIQMATSDVDVSVRVSVIQVLRSIDRHGLLEDDQRGKLCLLIFDEDSRIRKGVSGFVKGVWEDDVSDRLAGKKLSGGEKRQAEVKSLASLLVKWGKALDKLTIREDNSEDEESPSKRMGGVASIMDPEKKGRTALAVEALWDEIDPINDWEGLLNLLLLDHSAAVEEEDDEAPSSSSSPNGRTAVDATWRLSEAEEAIALELFTGSIRKAVGEATAAKKGEDQVVSDITRALIKGLPRLFLKHQGDESRIADVLLLPSFMNLETYLDMRMIPAYEHLWGDVAKQLLTHSSQTVLVPAVTAIHKFMSVTSLSNTNHAKILELEEELSTSLRDAIAGRDELDIAAFTEDESLTLGHICTRFAVLAKVRNLVPCLEEDEGGKQSSAYDILTALADRGKLGYREEETMVSETLNLLAMHILWKTNTLPSRGSRTPDDKKTAQALLEQRTALVQKLIEFTVGTQSNTAEAVKRVAFLSLMDLHILFSQKPEEGVEADAPSLSLHLDDEVQFRCSEFVQKEISRFKDHLQESCPQAKGGETDGSDAGESEEEHTKRGKKTKSQAADIDKRRLPKTASDLQREHVFIRVMLTFLRAIHAGAVHYKHSVPFLANYARLIEPFDICSKTIAEILRNEAILAEHSEEVCQVIIAALQDAYKLVLEGEESSKDPSISLAKLLTTCFVIRGAQLSIVGKIDPKAVVNVHTTLLSWIGRYITTYEKNGNNKQRAIAAGFFKVLLPLLSTIESRDALKIKAHMEQVLAQAKVRITPASKAWDAQRAYEKRLTTAMSKDKAFAPTKGRRGKRKDAGASSGAEEAESEPEPPAPKKPRPQPQRNSKRVTRESEPAASSDQEGMETDTYSDKLTDLEDEEEKEKEGDEEIDQEEPETPKAPQRTESPRKKGVSRTTSSPSPSRKRLREGEDVEMEDIEPAPTPAPELTQESIVEEVVVRRKRLRA